MRFMNEGDILAAQERPGANDLHRKLARFLGRFRGLVNSVSDGWAHWSAPVKACRKVFEVLEDGDGRPTEADVKKALTPVKAFCTKHKLTIPDLPV